MKRRLILWTTILSLVFILFGLVSCSETNAPNRLLQEKDLVGKLWSLNEYGVRVNNEGKYYVSLYRENICGFTEDGKIIFYNTHDHSALNYHISNELLHIGRDTYKIKKFTGDFIELISAEGMTSKEAQESGFGFRYKIELRKI